MLKWWVDPALGANRPIACASLEQLLELAGFRSAPAQDPREADIHYDSSFMSPRALPCAGRAAWDAIGMQNAIAYEDYFVPQASLVGSGTAGLAVDPVLAAYFFLSGRIEHDAHERAFARIPERATITEWRLHVVPAVQRLMNAIAPCIHGGLAPQPPWPRGKRWAMCLTHDCDRLLRFRTRGFQRDIFRRGASAPERVFSAAKALYSALHLPKGKDPYELSTTAWLQFERDMGIRGTYFVGTWSRHDSPAEAHDLMYLRSDPETLRLVDACKKYGAELGLHSSINSWTSAARFAEEVRRFQESYGLTPTGFRGHYWSLNADNPEESLALAARYGGMEYDSSFGMNVAYGFRRGTCYPFRPFDASTGEYSGLWELPPTVMDGGLHASAPNNEERIANFAALASSVKSANGVLVLDWHSDSLWDGFMSNMTGALMPHLADIVGDSSCWVAPASEIVEWCSSGRWRVPTP